MSALLITGGIVAYAAIGFGVALFGLRHRDEDTPWLVTWIWPIAVPVYFVTRPTRRTLFDRANDWLDARAARRALPKATAKDRP